MLATDSFAAVALPPRVECRERQLDEIQRHFYRLKCHVAFLSKKGTEFQDWFVRLAGYGLEGFEAVRPYGSMGDHKCDGWQPSTRTVFQCYAPYEVKEAKLNEKIGDDFMGACENWNLRKWVLVHNDTRGLPPTTPKLLEQLRSDQVAIDVWAEPEIQELAGALPLGKQEILFGFAPSMAAIRDLSLGELKEVLDDLSQAKPRPGEESLVPPSAEKIARNSLSIDVETLLIAGRRKEPLVEKYLRRSVDVALGERVAEAFRRRYAELKEEAPSSDDIFYGLQLYAGGIATSPGRQAAALAVLAYFFERCDIFEDDGVIG